MDRTHPPPNPLHVAYTKKRQETIFVHAHPSCHTLARGRGRQFSSSPSPSNQISGRHPLFLFILAHFWPKAKNPFRMEVKSLGVNEEDRDCYPANEEPLWREAICCYLSELDGSISMMKKKRNSSPVIMKTEAEQVNQKQQALGLNSLL